MNNPADLSVSPIKLRQNGRLMTTGYGNEIADKLNKSQGLPGTGQGSVNGTNPVSVIVKITDVLDDRPGWYSGKLFGSPPLTTKADIDNSEPLVEEDVGETGDDDNVTVWNISEINGGPPLVQDDVISGWIRNTDFGGKSIVIVQGNGSAQVISAEPESVAAVIGTALTCATGSAAQSIFTSGVKPIIDMRTWKTGGVLEMRMGVAMSAFTRSGVQASTLAFSVSVPSGNLMGGSIRMTDGPTTPAVSSMPNGGTIEIQARAIIYRTSTTISVRGESSSHLFTFYKDYPVATAEFTFYCPTSNAVLANHTIPTSTSVLDITALATLNSGTGPTTYNAVQARNLQITYTPPGNIRRA